MRQNKEVMVPFSVIKELNELHYRHMQELTDKLTAHLDRVVNRLLPAEHPEFQTQELWKSEEQEDAEYIAARERLAADVASELGFNSEDIKVE